MVYKLLLDQITLLVTLLDPNAPLTFLEAFYLGNGTIAFTKLGDELIAKGGGNVTVQVSTFWSPDTVT
jgi:hypothetical protein